VTVVRAVLKHGKIQPLDDLPQSWSEGQELLIEEGEPPVDPEEIAAWSREIEEAAARIPEEEHERFLAALEEVEKESKEKARREIGIP
jgi:hypothetical protein